MTASTKTRTGSPPLAIWKALPLSLPVFLITALLPLRVLESGDLPYSLAILVMWLGFNVAFILMLTTGQTHRYRSALFILLAVALPLEFIPMMIETHGSMMLTEEDIVGAEAKFCPLATFMVIVPALVKRILIFPGARRPLFGQEAHWPWVEAGAVGAACLGAGMNCAPGCAKRQ